MNTIIAKNIEKWVSGDDALMSSRSEAGEMFKCQEWKYVIPLGYRNCNYYPDIEVRGNRDGVDQHIAYLTPETKIWVLDSAMNIHLASENPALEFDNSEDYFINQGWNCQPDPLYEVKTASNRKELQDFIDMRMENWGD